MSDLQSCLYVGEVGHKRVAPVAHSLRYRVYDLFLDVADLPMFNTTYKFLSYNKFNLFSIYDTHFGARDGRTISEQVWSLVNASPCQGQVQRIFMLCYPAVLGRVFNPLTTFYCYDKNNQLVLMIYEVSNTFGQHHTYVIPFAGPPQKQAKAFYVSPFNNVEGDYEFSVCAPAETLKMNIVLHVAGKPILAAWFFGHRRKLNDAWLLTSFFSLPLQPLKVWVGIHWQALKLWHKGLALKPRPNPATPNVSFSKKDSLE
jgi:uncharacterized protein